MTIECPPKVNLFLRVVRKREDAFHELETVFQSVGGGDTLSAEAATDISLRCNWPEVPTDDRNLVIRAARLLRDRYPGAGGAALTLEKRTPVGAGMGGGSVDAAAALALLARQWGLTPSTDELASMAGVLGSDVPFFLHGGTALARGRGEQLTSLPTPPLWLVLVKPPVSVSTPWAYRQRRAEACEGPSLEQFVELLAAGDPEQIGAALRNDLEPGVIAEVPEIATAAEWLRGFALPGVRMTGSGSVVFGVARDEAQARAVAQRPGAPGQVWAAPCLSAAQARLTPLP